MSFLPVILEQMIRSR